MTFSEFGRRIKSNGSAGTDHGAAQPVFLFGEPVKQGVLGNPPDLPSSLDASSSLPMQYDFRSVYATVLRDWFCVDPADISTMLYKNYQYLPLVETTACNMPATHMLGDKLIRNDPNPFSSSTTITFKTDGGYTMVQIFDVSGKLVAVPVSARLSTGRIYNRVLRRSAGRWCLLCRLQNGSTQQVRTMIKAPIDQIHTILFTHGDVYLLFLFSGGSPRKTALPIIRPVSIIRLRLMHLFSTGSAFPDKVIWNFGDPASGFYNTAGIKTAHPFICCSG